MTELHRLADAALVRRVTAGDEAALATLFARYEGRLKAIVRKRLSPAVRRKISASDVLQEAYVAAHKRLAEFEERGDGSFGRWLARIVEHKAMHAVRRFAGTEKRGGVGEVTRGARPDTAAFAGRLPSPSQVAMGAERAAEVRGALARLPDDYREVLRLRQEEHRTLEEIAARMDRSKAAAKKLYARALARLAESLDLTRGGPDG